MTGSAIVHGYPSFDEQSKIAIVTINRLVRPFHERADLSQEPLAVSAVMQNSPPAVSEISPARVTFGDAIYHLKPTE